MAFSQVWPFSGCSFCASLARRSCWHAIWKATRNISRRCVTGWYHTSGDHPSTDFRSRSGRCWRYPTQWADRRQCGSNPGGLETLVLYRTGPAVSVPGDSESPAGRVRYSCLKEAARGEAFMQIQWCWVYEKGCGKREWSEQERSPDWFGGSLRGVGARV